jgi:hypothetical protein
MSETIKYGLAIFLLASIFLLTIKVDKNMFWYQFGPLTVLAALITDRTQWANDYTEKKFLSIEVGDSSDSVIRLWVNLLKLLT